MQSELLQGRVIAEQLLKSLLGAMRNKPLMKTPITQFFFKWSSSITKTELDLRFLFVGVK